MSDATIDNLVTKGGLVLFEASFALTALGCCCALGEVAEWVLLVVIKLAFKVTTPNVAVIEHMVREEDQMCENLLTLEIPIEDRASLSNSSFSSGYDLISERDRRRFSFIFPSRDTKDKGGWFLRLDYYTMDYTLYMVKIGFRILGVYFFFEILDYSFTKVIIALGVLGYAGVFATAQIIKKLWSGIVMRWAGEPKLGSIHDWQGRKVSLSYIGLLRSRLDDVTEAFDAIQPVIDSNDTRRKRKSDKRILVDFQGKHVAHDGKTTKYATSVRKFRLKHVPVINRRAKWKKNDKKDPGFRTYSNAVAPSDGNRLNFKDHSLTTEYKFRRYFTIPNDILMDMSHSINVLEKRRVRIPAS